MDRLGSPFQIAGSYLDSKIKDLVDFSKSEWVESMTTSSEVVPSVSTIKRNSTMPSCDLTALALGYFKTPAETRTGGWYPCTASNGFSPLKSLFRSRSFKLFAIVGVVEKTKLVKSINAFICLFIGGLVGALFCNQFNCWVSFESHFMLVSFSL